MKKRQSYTGDSYTTAWRRAKKRREVEPDEVPSDSLAHQETAPCGDRRLSPVQENNSSEMQQQGLSVDNSDVTTLTSHAIPSVPHETFRPEEDILGVYSTGAPEEDETTKTCLCEGSLQSSQTYPIPQQEEIANLSSSVSSVEDNLTGVRDDDFEVAQPGPMFESSSPHSIHLSGDERPSAISSVSDSGSSTDDSDTDSSVCDPHCFEAHFLEEAPIFEDLQDEQEDDPNPDDPDNEGSSEGDSDDEPSADEESDDDSDGDLATFTSEELNHPAALANVFTKGQLILIQLATACRHNKSFECLLDDFRNMNLLLGKNWLPESKSKLFACINLKKKSAKFYAYCGKQECGSYIGRKDRLPQMVRCPKCNHTMPLSKTPFFVMLNFRKQLQAFLRIPGIWEKLQYRHTRVKGSDTAIEDVFDCSRYQALRAAGGPLESEFNFSYVVNTDAFKPFKKCGKLKAWPILARINELPPDMRQRFTFLVALYVDSHDPNFQSFLKPFVAEANKLSLHGISWKPDGINDQISRFVCFCNGVDAPARCAILQMNTVTGYYGCTCCVQEGVRLAGSSRYSFLDEHGNYLETEDRTHEGMEADMIASRHGESVRGHKGLSQLLLLHHFDLRLGQAHDDLHQDHEGCAKDLTDLLLTEVEARVGREHTAAIDVIREVDRRLLPIQTPSIIARKPSTISRRGSWRGTAWRNWLLYFCVPVLSGLIFPAYERLIAHLSRGCYLLSQDAIEVADLVQARRNFESLGKGFQEKFGLEKVKYNLHATRHKVKSVQTLGPPWNTSTYNFESLNGKLGPMITSPKGIITQIVTRCFILLTVNLALYDETLPQRVQKRLQDITSKLKLKRVLQMGLHTYVAGKVHRRRPTPAEQAIFYREGLIVNQVNEYPQVLKGRMRCKSIHHQQDSKSDDSFIYTTEDTFCTINRILVFTDVNGEEHCGLMVREHDVARHLEVASHIAVLRGNNADIMHYIDISKVKCPAIKFTIDQIVYAVAVPNCHEID